MPVGKDSLSMQSRWKSDDGADRRVVSPVTLNVTAFAPVTDARRTLTPFLPEDVRELFLGVAGTAPSARCQRTRTVLSGVR